jgi:general secretion pathway protein K
MMRSRQRGVALLTAVVLVALATMLAVAIGSRGMLGARRSIANSSLEQGLQYAQGAEALAVWGLSQQRGARDSLEQPWAQPLGPLEVAPGVLMAAQLSDEQGKFNLNTVINARGEVDPEALKLFTRLLELLQLEPRWAVLWADWIDTDVLPGSNGAEDSVYLSQTVPHRTANMPVTSVSELLQLPGFDLARYTRLAPYVTALPPAANKINVCTAAGPLLDALFVLSPQGNATTEYSRMSALELAALRKRGCFPELAVLRSTVGASVERRATEQSRFFRLRSDIGIGTDHFALYSLLMREDSGLVRPLLRTLGTE